MCNLQVVCIVDRDSSVSGLRVKRQASSEEEGGYGIIQYNAPVRFPNTQQRYVPVPNYNTFPSSGFHQRGRPAPVRLPQQRNIPKNNRRKNPTTSNPAAIRRNTPKETQPVSEENNNPVPSTQGPNTPNSGGNGPASAQNSVPKESPNNDTPINDSPILPSIPDADSRLVHNIIVQAVRNVRVEDRFLELRLILGIDKTLDQFTSMEPALFSESPFDVAPLSRQSRIINWISTIIRDFKLSIPVSTVLTHPSAVNHKLTCPYVTPTCDFSAKYRTIDGSCNNVNRPLQGAAFTPMARELNPVYENDPLGKIDLPRARGTLGPLPSARLISSVVHSDRGADERATRWSMQLTLWGQMIAHDITDRAPGKGFNSAVMSCCNQRIKTPFCFGIPVPKDDILRDRGLECLDFTRTAEVTDIDCKLGRREQLNQASSYLDAGFIYGVAAPKLKLLRLGEKGLMATSMNGHLPIIPHTNSKASLQGFAFFATGDDRVNEHTGLMGIETTWVREHNRIAEILTGLNPHWDDERTFLETKRIVSAMLQHITYNEYLPQIVGNATMDLYNLWPLKEGYSKGYSAETDASATNAFTSAVYRFGHSMIRSKFSLMDKSFNSTDNSILQLKDTFFTSITFLETEHRMMRGTMMDQSEPCDRMLSTDLLNNLLQTRNGNGRDLASLNIQRGRDHGLPSYTAWRRLYNFTTANEFTNTTEGFIDHPAETVELFKQIYSHPEDVDLWTAGISETPLDDAAVGPLFSTMIGHQFQKIRNGDRYFYDSDAQPVPFSPEQLQAIRKVTYSSILCYNLHFKTIQPEAFLLTSDTKNDKIPCTSIRGLNLQPWKERPSSNRNNTAV